MRSSPPKTVRPPSPPCASTTSLGRAAESLVAAEYERHGFSVLARNVRLGPLELDLVLERDSLLVVCEVRSRATDAYGHPAATVDARKRQRIRVATARWLAERNERRTVRFDVVTVLGRGESARIVVYRNAF